MRFAILTFVTSLYAFGVMAQTSPDGSSITAPGSAQLVAQGSTWAFGHANPSWAGQYDVVKDGVDIGWSGDAMWVLNAGKLYMVDSYNTVWLWQPGAGTFVQVPGLPTAPPPPSSTNPPKTITINVGPGGQYAHIADAVGVANSDGDPRNYYVLNLVPGTYLNDFATVFRPMTIQVDPTFAPQRAILQATVPLPNQKGIILTFASLTVRGLEFTGAMIGNGLGGNGAGIRDQIPDNTPASLVVDNSVFHDNQEGILQCCDADETVRIVNSQFKNNGNPDQNFFQHGIYINQAAKLEVINSLFCGQLIGHEVKSRAAQTVVTGSQIYTGEGAPASTGCRVGNASFNIQVANGGIAMISGNTLVQGPSAQNHKIISYGSEGVSYVDNSLTVSNNRFFSTAGSIGISDPPCVPVQLDATNTFSGLSAIVDPAGCSAPTQ